MGKQKQQIQIRLNKNPMRFPLAFSKKKKADEKSEPEPPVGFIQGLQSAAGRNRGKPTGSFCCSRAVPWAVKILTGFAGHRGNYLPKQANSYII